jgi:hypothetical protein
VVTFQLFFYKDLYSVFDMKLLPNKPNQHQTRNSFFFPARAYGGHLGISTPCRESTAEQRWLSDVWFKFAILIFILELKLKWLQLSRKGLLLINCQSSGLDQITWAHLSLCLCHILEISLVKVSWNGEGVIVHPQ